MTKHISSHLFHHRSQTQHTPRPKKKSTRLYIDHEYLDSGYLKTFKPSVTMVYLVLARHANYHTQRCFPSIERMIRLTGVRNRNTVFQAIKMLEASGLIHVLRSKGRHSNRYTLLSTRGWQQSESPQASNV